MQNTIALIGYGQTRFGEWWEKSLRDLMEEAVAAAIDNAAINVLDIDMVVVANMIGEATNAQAHLGALAASFLPHQPPALRVEAACASGAVAIHTACSLLESGKAGTVLVVGAEKMTDVPADAVSAALMGAADSEKDLPCGLTFPGIFGLIAERYMYEYELTREELSQVSARHHENAQQNPYAQFRKPISPECISQSSLIADPLRLLDCSPISDGAAAVVLSTQREAPVRIAASQLSTDALSLADRPRLTSFPATQDAMEGALREAGIERTDISAVELHDCFSIAAVVNVEDLGFTEPGTGAALYAQPDNQLTLNASGGLKACGHPVGATGVKQVVDVAKQLTAASNRWGLTHNIGGAGATCGIHILEHLSS